MSIDVKRFVLDKLGEKQVNQLSNEEFAQLLSDIFNKYDDGKTREQRSSVRRVI